MHLERRGSVFRCSLRARLALHEGRRWGDVDSPTLQGPLKKSPAWIASFRSRGGCSFYIGTGNGQTDVTLRLPIETKLKSETSMLWVDVLNVKACLGYVQSYLNVRWKKRAAAIRFMDLNE